MQAAAAITMLRAGGHAATVQTIKSFKANITPSTDTIATLAALPAKKCERDPTPPIGPIAVGSDGGIFGVTSDENGNSNGSLYEITP